VAPHPSASPARPPSHAQPFFETIGHSAAIIQAYPELGWCNGVQGSGLPHPLRNETWAFFDSLWKEYRGVFADEQMNVGGEWGGGGARCGRVGRLCAANHTAAVLATAHRLTSPLLAAPAAPPQATRSTSPAGSLTR
jgi:hypothetical protein